MGFLLLSDTGQVGPDIQQKYEDSVLHRLGCKACPLSKFPGRMEPTGAAKPTYYFLGEAPGVEEIKQGRQFIGRSGQILRSYLPERYESRVRWNNVVRSHPPNNRDPERIEIEACRPSVAGDIERSQPKAIFGFGNVPLRWVSGFSGISVWRGRYMPVRIGAHTCWYFAFNHPAAFLHSGKDKGAEDERMFGLDMARAFSLLERLPPPEVHTPEQVYAGVEILRKCNAETLRRLEVLLGSAAKAAEVGIDYETKGLRPYKPGSKILTIAVSTEHSTFAFPFDHPEANWSPAHRRDLETLWKAFLKHAKGVKIAHNLAFELEQTGVHFGEEFVRAGRWEDSAVQAAIIDNRTGKMKPGPFALEFLVQQYFGFNIKQMSGVDRQNLANEPLDEVLRYNAPDAKYGRLLWAQQAVEIKRQHLTEAYELALRRVPTVVISQMRGVPVDQATVEQLQKKYKARLKTIEDKIAALPIVERFYQREHREYNPASNPDTLIIFNKMLKRSECKVYDKKKKRDTLSVKDEVLEKIGNDEPLAQLLRDYRTVSRNISNYIDPLHTAYSKSVVYPDGCIHSTFNTFFAETGRLSSEDPNLQNFPKREDESKEVRRSIRANPGHWILAFDYGQIEARTIAMFTKDKVLVDYLWTHNSDIHYDWAVRIAHAYPKRVGGERVLKGYTVKGSPEAKAMKDFRTDIKNQWTFPLVYGCTLKSAAGYLSIPIDYLEPEFEAFWTKFQAIKEWQSRQLDFYHEYGYIECLTGRRRVGPFTVNQVYNTPVQGTAAEIVLDAMSRLSETGDPLLQPEINIHDDLTFVRVPKNKFDYVVENVVTMMLDVPFPWAKIVPTVVELSVGENWMKMEEIERFYSDQWLGHKRKD